MHANEAAAIIADTLNLDPLQRARLEVHLGVDDDDPGEQVLTAPSVMLAANERDDGKPLEMPPVFHAKADELPAADALAIIARYAGLTHDDRKKLARMLDSKKLAKLGAAIESVQKAFNEKPDRDAPLSAPAVMLRGTER